MKASSRMILAIALFILVFFNLGSFIGSTERSRSDKTDLKIITYLGSGGFITPAIIKNGSFAYNNFEFNLYSNLDNSTYEIKIDNKTIVESSISDFKDVYTWKTSKSYLSKIDVDIGNDTYSYSNIFVFSSSVYNSTNTPIDNLISFTPKELELYIQEIQLIAFRDTFMGLLFIFVCGYVGITKYKKETTKRIL